MINKFKNVGSVRVQKGTNNMFRLEYTNTEPKLKSGGSSGSIELSVSVPSDPLSNPA